MSYTTYIFGTEAVRMMSGPLCQHVNSTGRSTIVSGSGHDVCTYCLLSIRWYESNWRILHIDGFEPGYRPLPKIRYEFTVSAAPPCRRKLVQRDGYHVWVKCDEL